VIYHVDFLHRVHRYDVTLFPELSFPMALINENDYSNLKSRKTKTYFYDHLVQIQLQVLGPIIDNDQERGELLLQYKTKSSI
jgi:hypothetical protein